MTARRQGWVRGCHCMVWHGMTWVRHGKGMPSWSTKGRDVVTGELW